LSQRASWSTLGRMVRWPLYATIGRWVAAALGLIPFFALFDGISPSGRLPFWVQAALAAAPSVVFAWFFLKVLGSRTVLPAAAAVGGFVGLTLVTVYALPHPSVPSAGSLLVFAALMIGAGFEWRIALPALIGLLILETALNLQSHPLMNSAPVVGVLNTGFVGLSAIAGRLLVIGYLQLVAAREEIARLVVAEERLRFARDLHDLLGQTLATIVLKGEVVGRRLPADYDPDVRQDLHEMVRLARRSLDEVREAVAGYRQSTVESELVNALIALRAGGITATVDNLAGPLSSEEENVFSWALREALTNVVKHSGARQCRILLRREDGRVALEVTDDGRGADGPVRLGSGLRGIRERAELAGGRSTIEATPDGFRTLVELPAE